MAGSIDRRSFLSRGLLSAAGVAVVGAAGGSLLEACSSSAPSGAPTGGARIGVSTATPRRGGSLVFAVEAEEQGFDPSTARFDETGVLYARTVFDPLTIIAADGTIQPYLAKAVTPNEDYSVWTVTTRPGVTFHDGTPCDAAAVAGSLEHFLSGLLGITLSPVQSVKAPTSDTVVITLKQPWVPFNAYLAGGIGGQAGYIIAPAMIANPNGSTQPVGTGPFKFSQWEPNDHFTALRNPDYWRTGTPYLDSLTFRPIVDSQSRAEALLAGNVNIMHTDDPEVILQFRSNQNYGYVDDSKNVLGEPDMNFIMLNLEMPPLNDLRVRQAMAMAISSAQYAKVVDKGVNAPINQPFVPGSAFYAADSGYPAYDPAHAQTLVQQVQRDLGKPVAFTLISTTSAAAVQAAQYVQNRLQAVGMQVDLAQVQQADEINDALGGKFQAVEWRQFGAVDPDLNYLWWSPTEIFPSLDLAPNFARNTDPVIETLLQEGRRSTDPSVRARAYQQIAQRLNRDLPYIWNDRATWAIVAKSNVQDFNNATTPSGGAAYGMIVGTIWTSQIWLEA